MKSNLKWSPRTKVGHLTELQEQVRFYRQFHHTLFSISTASYSGLIVMQATILTRIIEQSVILSTIALVVIKYAIPITILLLIPMLFTYMFITRHFDQGIIRDKINTLERDLGFPEKYVEHKKYEGFKSKTNWQKFCIGRGHPVYIVITWLLVSINWLLFFLLSSYIK